MCRAAILLLMVLAIELKAQAAPGPDRASRTVFGVALGVGMMDFNGEPDVPTDFVVPIFMFGVERRLTSNFLLRGELLTQPVFIPLGTFSDGLFGGSASLLLPRWGTGVHLLRHFGSFVVVGVGATFMRPGACDIDVAYFGDYTEPCHDFAYIRVTPVAVARSGVATIQATHEILSLSLRYDHGLSPVMTIDGNPVHTRSLSLVVGLQNRK